MSLSLRMKADLIINTNISHAIETLDNELNVIYSPVVKSEPQKLFYQKRFSELKKRYTSIKFSPIHDIQNLIESTQYSIWDSWHEKQSVGDSSFSQNRLFDSFEDIPEGFTPFKKIAEKRLPMLFDNVLAPYDQEVIDELDYYFDEKKLAHHYFNTRNGMLHRNDSTRLSAYLSCGVLDVRYLYNRVKIYEKKVKKNKSTYWIIFELLWREFFYWHYQKHQQKYFSANGLHSELNFTSYEDIKISDLIKNYGDNPFILAACRELEATGFQTNRTRQIFASFIIQCTDYHWRQGASLFEKYLIDYDVYSNWGNWMYLAGVGVDPRGSRFFHIAKQMKNYDPRLEYIYYWCPEYKDLDRNEILKRCLKHQE